VPVEGLKSKTTCPTNAYFGQQCPAPAFFRGFIYLEKAKPVSDPSRGMQGLSIISRIESLCDTKGLLRSSKRGG
jgi:hypothetical protein